MVSASSNSWNTSGLRIVRDSSKRNGKCQRCKIIARPTWALSEKGHKLTTAEDLKTTKYSGRGDGMWHVVVVNDGDSDN